MAGLFYGLHTLLSLGLRSAGIMLLWSWFVTPYFGILQIRVIPAVGLGLMATWLTHNYDPLAVRQQTEWKQQIAVATAHSITEFCTIIGMGALIHYIGEGF